MVTTESTQRSLTSPPAYVIDLSAPDSYTPRQHVAARYPGRVQQEEATMLRYSLLSAVLLAAAGSAHASSWADGMFDELSKDFGSVPHGTMAVHPFRLVNNTSSPVRITNVRVSCGCTSAKALQTYLAPGQDTAIYAQMDTGRFYGTKNVTIFVQFDQPHFEEVRLWVQANSRDDVTFSPDSLELGKIKRGNAASADITVTFSGNSQTKITETKCESNYLTAEFKEVRRSSGDVAYKITAKIRADAPAGKWYSDVWVKTNNPNVPRLRVPLSVEIDSALSISPATVILGQVKAGTESDRKVILRGAQPFRITNISGTDENVRVREASAEAKTVHVLTVTVNPVEPGEWNRTLKVQTDLKSGGEIEFSTQANVVP